MEICTICNKGVKNPIKSKCVFLDEHCKVPANVHKKCDSNLYAITINAQKTINKVIRNA